MQRIHLCTLSVWTIAHISLTLTHNPFISSPHFYLSSHLSALLRRCSKTCTPSLPSWLATLLSPPSLPPSQLLASLLRSPLVVFDSSKAGSRRANSRWTHFNTQLCHLLWSHDWAAKPALTPWCPIIPDTSINHDQSATEREDGGSEGESRRARGNQNKSVSYEVKILACFDGLIRAFYYNWIGFLNKFNHFCPYI